MEQERPRVKAETGEIGSGDFGGLLEDMEMGSSSAIQQCLSGRRETRSGDS